MIICFDLDGTICNTDDSQPIPERYINATINIKMKNFLVRLYNNGHTIFIDTARCSGTKGIKNIFTRYRIKQLTCKQLKDWGIPYHKLRVGVKLPADLYIDDKCLPVNVIENSK